ncbi:MAG: hypothetical protein ACRC1V_12790, partial [Plesiomonas sp.]
MSALNKKATWEGVKSGAYKFGMRRQRNASHLKAKPPVHSGNPAVLGYSNNSEISNVSQVILQYKSISPGSDT